MCIRDSLGVGINDNFLPPVQISVVDVKNWQKRGEHNELEANQIQVSSLMVLTHLEKVTKTRKNEVISELKKINPVAEIVTMESLDFLALPELFPTDNTAQKLDHQKTHWSSCSIDLPVLPNEKCVYDICNCLLYTSPSPRD